MSTNTTSESTATQPIINKILGIHPQRQDGLFMQRIKIFAGRLTWRQWRKIAQLAALYSQDTPLHLTTRQDIELHNIPSKNISAIQRGLAEEAIAVFAAGGDSIRNITVSPGAKFEKDGFDLEPLAQLVRQYLEQSPLAFQLHRKFKISFSGSQKADAKPYLNDLAFIAQSDCRFTVVGAGSLSPKPALGIELYTNLPAKDVLPLCLAAVQFFAEHGERKNRTRARFRHVREKFGDHTFKKELDNRLNRLKSSQPWPSITPTKISTNIKLLHRLQPPNGNITSQQAVELADVAEPNGTILRINLEHGLELYGTQNFELPPQLASFATNPIITTCPGASTCTKVLTNGQHVADTIRKILKGKPRTNVRVNISSCPNNCAHSAAAEIGLVGIIKKENGKPSEYYRLFTGGNNGKSNKLAEYRDTIPAQHAPSAVKCLLEKLKAEKKQNR